jgi:hypothetical protein
MIKTRVVIVLEFDNMDCESEDGSFMVQDITEDCRMIRHDYDASRVFVKEAYNVIEEEQTA